MTSVDRPRIIARARVGNPPVKDPIASAIISLLGELKRGKQARWSPKGITWRDIYTRSCRLHYDGRRCRYSVAKGPGGHSGIPPGPAADVFNEYCVSLLDALANQRQVIITQSLHIGHSGIIWKTSQDDTLAMELRAGGYLTAGINPGPLSADTPGLSTYSVWD